MRSCRVVGLHQVDGIPTSPNAQDHQTALTLGISLTHRVRQATTAKGHRHSAQAPILRSRSQSGAVCGPSQRTKPRSTTRYNADQRRTMSAGQRCSRSRDQEACLVSQKILSICKDHALARRADLRDSHKNCCGWASWTGCDISAPGVVSVGREHLAHRRSSSCRPRRKPRPGGWPSGDGSTTCRRHPSKWPRSGWSRSGPPRFGWNCCPCD